MPLQFGFLVLADISKALPEFSVINQTTWSDGTTEQTGALTFFFKLESPSGLVLFDSGVTPFKTGNNWTTAKLPATIPLVNGHVEWGGTGYVVTGYVKIADGTAQPSFTYSIPVCRPKGNTIKSTDNYGAMHLNVTASCDDAKLYIEEKTDYVYKGLAGSTASMKLRLVRPADTPEDMPTVEDRLTAFSILAFDLYKDGDGYQLIAESVREYIIATGVVLRLKYKFKTSFDVRCAVDLCAIIKGVDRWREELRGQQCTGADMAALALMNNDLSLLLLVKSQPLCGVDLQPILNRIICGLGSYYNPCGCGNGAFYPKQISNTVINAGAAFDKQIVRLTDNDVTLSNITGVITCTRIAGYDASNLVVQQGNSLLDEPEYIYHPEGTFELVDHNAYGPNPTLTFYGPKTS